MCKDYFTADFFSHVDKNFIEQFAMIVALREVDGTLQMLLFG